MRKMFLLVFIFLLSFTLISCGEETKYIESLSDEIKNEIKLACATKNEQDIKYKDLVSNEIIFVRKNQTKIYNNAKILYKQKITNDLTAGYVKSALDYKYLETLCDNFTNNMSI